MEPKGQLDLASHLSHAAFVGLKAEVQTEPNTALNAENIHVLLK
jgi:hypothetical protein